MNAHTLTLTHSLCTRSVIVGGHKLKLELELELELETHGRSRNAENALRRRRQRRPKESNSPQKAGGGREENKSEAPPWAGWLLPVRHGQRLKSKNCQLEHTFFLIKTWRGERKQGHGQGQGAVTGAETGSRGSATVARDETWAEKLSFCPSMWRWHGKWRPTLHVGSAAAVPLRLSRSPPLLLPLLQLLRLLLLLDHTKSLDNVVKHLEFIDIFLLFSLPHTRTEKEKEIEGEWERNTHKYIHTIYCLYIYLFDFCCFRIFIIFNSDNAGFQLHCRLGLVPSISISLSPSLPLSFFNWSSSISDSQCCQAQKRLLLKSGQAKLEQCCQAQKSNFFFRGYLRKNV